MQPKSSGKIDLALGKKKPDSGSGKGGLNMAYSLDDEDFDKYVVHPSMEIQGGRSMRTCE